MDLLIQVDVVLEQNDYDDREIIQNVKVPRSRCQVSNQSGVLLADIIRQLQDRGYRFKLGLADMALSYFDCSKNWFVFAGRASDIGTLIVPFGALNSGKRLTIKARSLSKFSYNIADSVND